MRHLIQHYAHPLHIGCRILAVAQAMRIHADLRAIIGHPLMLAYARVFTAVAYRGARP